MPTTTAHRVRNLLTLSLALAVLASGATALSLAPARAEAAPVLKVLKYQVKSVTMTKKQARSHKKSVKITAQVNSRKIRSWECLAKPYSLDFKRGGAVVFSSKKPSATYTVRPDPRGAGLGAYGVFDKGITGITTSGKRIWPSGRAKEARFYVRMRATAKIKVKHTGSNVRIRVSAKRLGLPHGAPASHTWTYLKYSAKRVKVQTKAGRNWKTIKTVSLSGGATTLRLKKRAKASYRAVVPTTAVTKGLTTRTVRK